MLHSNLIRPPSRICKPRIMIGEDCGEPAIYCHQWSAQYIEETIKGCQESIHEMANCLLDHSVNASTRFFPDTWAEPDPVEVEKLTEDWEQIFVRRIVREANRLLRLYGVQEFRRVVN